MSELHKVCLICSSKLIIELDRFSSSYLCKCKSCNFVFSQKIPSEKELIDHYKGYGRNDYLSPITIKRYNEILDIFENYKITGNILDVGCGIGYFLEEAKKRGWNVYGTEYTNQAVNICENKGIKMYKGKLEPENFTSNSFDIITSFEVIEHINNPSEEIQNYYKLLRKGGLFYCTTPNFNSISRRILKEKWNTICYPEHLSYYTSKTLSNLLKLNDFSTIKVKTTGISINIFKKSLGKTNQKIIEANSDDENLRQKMENKILFNYMKKVLNRVLTIFRLGDTIKIYAEKK